jgi:hypothetical protein
MFKVISLSGGEFQVESDLFDLSWIASTLSLSTAPAGCTGGLICLVQPVIQVSDSKGYLLSSQDADVVTAAISLEPPGITETVLRGNVKIQVNGGIAKFTDLSIDVSHETAYSVRFFSAELSLAVNASFTITTGVPYLLIIIVSCSWPT